MKKLISITAIILVVSIISTLCFAAALGTEFIDYAANGELDQALEKLENKLEALDDRLDGSYFDYDDYDDYDGMLKSKTTVEPEAYTADSITIGTDAAEVVLMPSQDGNFSAEVMTYSRHDSDSVQAASILRDYSENGTEYTVYIKSPDTAMSYGIKAVFYIPDTVKTVVFKSSVGKIKADGGIVLDSLDANVETGSASLERADIDKCNINVETGKIDIENGFTVRTSLTAHVATGKIDCRLPFADSYTVTYSAQSCELDSDMPINIRLFDSNGNPTSTVKPSGKLTSAGTSENTVEADFSVDTGKIEFDTD